MRYRRLIFIHIQFILFFISCQNLFETGDEKLVANTGPDQMTIAGSYAILDASKSRGAIDWYQWEQDEKNPVKVKIFSGNENYTQQIGFVKEGVYLFKLTVRSGVTPGNLSGTNASEPDEVIVTVTPNPQNLFEDPNLEIAVRFMLRNQIEELRDDMLLSLDSLRYFDGAEEISSLKGIEHCENLRCLQMGHQSISDISPIATLTKLKVLNFTQNRKISDITPLAELTELEWLDLDSNLITDISPLRNLVRLKFLNLQLNPIENINAIKNMLELETFFLFRAALEDISAASNLVRLTQLWLVDCGLRDISRLTNLVNIKNLHLAWNQISDINPLSNFKKLEWVALEKNNISDISPLRDLSNLRYVRLWDNQITNIKPLVDNPGIGKGDIVGLDGNPLDEKSVNEYIPALRARGVEVTWK